MSEHAPPTIPTATSADTTRRQRPEMTRWPLIRDMLLFFGGLAGVAYETLGSNVDRPTLLLLFAAMMGLPAFLRADDSKKGDK